jgi:hypothetical protein
MRWLTWLVPLFLAGLLGTAQAQVATTDLVPAAPTFIHLQASGLNTANITPDNPAALAWGTPSRVAAGMLDGTDDDKTLPPPVDFKGTFYGARFVGSTFGFAAEQLEVKGKVGNVPMDKANDVQLSLNLGNKLALGIGAGHFKSPATGPAPTDASRKELGASLRLGDMWYVGLAGYQDENTLPASAGSFKRNGMLAGVALRTEGAWKWYLAADYIKLKGFDYGVFGASPDFKETRFTAQVLANWLLLGASTTKVGLSGGGGGNPDVKNTAVDIGFAPMQNLTVTARAQRTRITGGTNNETVDTKSVALAWLW